MVIKVECIEWLPMFARIKYLRIWIADGVLSDDLPKSVSTIVLACSARDDCSSLLVEFPVSAHVLVSLF